MNRIRTCIAALALTCVLGVCLAGEAAPGTAANANGEAATILLENQTGIFTMLAIAFSEEGRDAAEGGREIRIEPDAVQAIPNPGLAKANVDFYMGMNNVHFLFENVPLRGTDRLAIGFTKDSTPTLEAFANNAVIHVQTGALTLDDMSAP